MRLLSFFLIATLVFAACKKDPQPNNPIIKQPNPIPVTDVQKRLIQSDNAFGLNIFKEIEQKEDPDENIFISPLSISMVLGMVLNGASGDTKIAMQAALDQAGLSQNDINAAYRALKDALLQADPSVLLSIANSIWYRENFPVESDFIQVNRQFFDAEVKSLDFDRADAKDIINLWVENATNGLIDEIIKEITPDHVMFLINAIYFKASWTWQFDPADTRQGAFFRPNGSQVITDMMWTEDIPFRYYGDQNVDLIELDYGRGNFSMVAIMPKNPGDISSFIAGLSVQQLNSLIAQADTQHYFAFLEFPKFELGYEIELNQALEALGMGIAFSPGLADFSGISSAGNLFISEVKHKTYVKLDEQGTEAAAVTSVGVAITSLPPSLVFNRPFVIIIREKETGSLLFLGKITDPSV